MTKLGAKRLLKLADYLENVVAKYPKGKDGQPKFNMQHWFRAGDCGASKPGVGPKSCGTQACALGWCAAIWPKKIKVEESWPHGTVKLVGSEETGIGVAMEFFGISKEAAFELFAPQKDYFTIADRSAKQEARIIRTFVRKETKNASR